MSSRLAMAKLAGSCLKVKIQKKAVRMAPVVENLCSMCAALSSTPSIKKYISTVKPPSPKLFFVVARLFYWCQFNNSLLVYSGFLCSYGSVFQVLHILPPFFVPFYPLFFYIFQFIAA
jgi:hypothetical protein